MEGISVAYFRARYRWKQGILPPCAPPNRQWTGTRTHVTWLTSKLWVVNLRLTWEMVQDRTVWSLMVKT